MKLPDAVIDKLQDGEAPVTHAAVIEDVEMIIRYTCDGKVIGQTMYSWTATSTTGAPTARSSHTLQKT